MTELFYFWFIKLWTPKPKFTPEDKRQCQTMRPTTFQTPMYYFISSKCPWLPHKWIGSKEKITSGKCSKSEPSSASGWPLAENVTWPWPSCHIWNAEAAALSLGATRWGTSNKTKIVKSFAIHSVSCKSLMIIIKLWLEVCKVCTWHSAVTALVSDHRTLSAPVPPSAAQTGLGQVWVLRTKSSGEKYCWSQVLWV